MIETLATAGGGGGFTYTFTDLSPSLVAAAKRKFAKWPMVQYAVVNVEEDPPAHLLNAFDIVLSTNCIHATHDLVKSTTNIRKMLRPDGILCLVELTRNLYWFDLVFGLLEGWWLFDDGREHALAHERRWDTSLRAAGFEWVDWTSSAARESDTLRVITASPFNVDDDVGAGRRDSVPAAGSGQEVSVSRNNQGLATKETVTFKTVDNLQLQADIFYPDAAVEAGRRLPIGKKGIASPSLLSR
jgi:SAM-dependent methyltransferase